jgi:DNA-binding transcriptional ArsR family regulator
VTGRSRAPPQPQKPRTILTSLITSKTRLKLLLKFFSRPDAVGHLRGLAEEFGDSTNSVRVELNKLEEAGLLVARAEGQKVVYEVNKSNPFYSDLVGMVSKFLGFDVLVAQFLEQVGNLEEAYVVGDYARGVDSGTISLVLVGDLNEERVHALCARVSTKINRTVAVTIAPNATTVSSPFLQII